MLLLRAAVRRQHGHRRPLASIPIPIHTRPLAAAASTTASSASLPAGHQANHNSPHQPRSGPVDFSDTAAAYSSLKTLDLVRGYLVFRACGLRPLVTHADAVLRNSYRFLGKGLTEALIKATFFRHFCAGETAQGIRPRVEQLRKGGVGGILDYAAEADVVQMASPAQAETTQAYTEGAITCRVYDYESERRCDAHVATFLDCIDAVKNVTPEGFAAIKVTALGNPALLERMSACIVELRNLFQKFDTQGQGHITRAQFVEGYNKYFLDDSSSSTTTTTATSSSSGSTATPAERVDPALDRLLAKLDPKGKDRIDYIEWSNTLTLRDVPALTSRCREAGPLKLASLSDEETELMGAMQARLDTLARHAAALGVRLMIDAEQSYLQEAIDNIVIDLQRRYNTGAYPVVFGTYQCYLKDARQRMHTDMDRAARLGYHFAAKLVRGAYMVSERQRAQKMGYPSPIHDTIEATHACYDGNVQMALEAMARGEKVELLVASHNQASIEKALAGMGALGLEPTTSGVYFGQLLGMADHLTLSLGRHGYKAYKYVPYGRVGEVVPYLIRRAQENSDVLGGVGKELGLLQREIRRRILPF